MRQIEFRGLRTDGKGWVYGLPFYSHGTGEWKITTSNGWTPSYANPDEGERTEYHEVRPETVGQFINSNDRDGDKIFDGDLVRVNEDSPVFEVFWSVQEMKWAMRHRGMLFNLNFEILKKCGSIHKSPELINQK